jgi:hypothetical protein
MTQSIRKLRICDWVSVSYSTSRKRYKYHHQSW